MATKCIIMPEAGTKDIYFYSQLQGYVENKRQKSTDE